MDGNQGFILIHSVPKFPEFFGKRNKKIKIEIPKSGHKYG